MSGERKTPWTPTPYRRPVGTDRLESWIYADDVVVAIVFGDTPEEVVGRSRLTTAAPEMAELLGVVARGGDPEMKAEDFMARVHSLLARIGEAK